MIRKLRLFSRFVTWQTGQQIIGIHKLANISRTMKFCQWIEYNMRNIFLKKWYKEGGEDARPRPFCKKSKLNISLDHSVKYCKVCCISKWRSKIKLFEKQKEAWIYSPWIIFYIIFEEKYFSHSHNIGKYGYCNCLLSSLWRHKAFEIK